MSETAHVGPIVFSNKHARAQLGEYGEVVTFRSKRTTGKKWWRESRIGAKCEDVYGEELEKATPVSNALVDYQPTSGFPSTRAWRNAIDKLHGGNSGYLYRVTTRGRSDD